MKRFYALLLHLFPKAYREEYGDELQAVFSLTLDEAQKAGKLAVMWVFLRELIGLPGAMLYEHLRERKRTIMPGRFASRFDFAPGSRKETLAALAPFLFFGALPVSFSILDNYAATPIWLQIAMRLFLVFLVLGFFTIGLVKGVPRWAFPYLGLPLPVASLLLFNSLPEFPAIFWSRLYNISWFAGAFVFSGLTLVGVLLAFVLLVLVTAIIPKFFTFRQRLRDDWTLLCLLLYGSLPFILVILFDEYRNEEPYLILAFLALALGAWLYLRSEQAWKKFLSLFSGMSLSMLITMVGQELLYDSSFPWSNLPSWTMTMSTVIYGIWLTLFMLLPFMLSRLPRGDDSRQAG